MYIEPNSTIKIIYQCPLDASYENTLWFDTVADQINYFQNVLGGYTFSKQSYQRVNKNSFRIAKPAEEMYDCNYIAFRNISFGSKWFYAFIDKIEYVNNVTSEITYTIDVMQTWHFDYSMEQCFVEREHSVTDNPGDNIVAENIDTGDYITDNNSISDVATNYEIVIWATVDDDYDESFGVKRNTGYQWIYSGLTPIRFPMTSAGITSAVDWLANLPASKTNAIVSMNVSPVDYDYNLEITKRILPSNSGIERYGNGGVIKNNKLYTYPFNFLYITNNQGNSAVYRYEFFDSVGCNFAVYANSTNPNPTILMTPKNYKGATLNIDERIDLNGFPQVAWNVDSFKAWLAQSASSIALSGIASGIGIAMADTSPMVLPSTGSQALVPSAGIPEGASVGPVTDGGVMGVIALGVALLPMIKQAISGVIHQFMPPQSRGQQGSNTLLGFGKFCYTVMNKHITKDYATIIDDYFTMYGYQTNKVKYPNRNSRPEWNYVKTVGCKIRSGIPSDDAIAIELLYDRGIRFWKNPQHIGNYTFDNSPVQDNQNIPNG